MKKAKADDRDRKWLDRRVTSLKRVVGRVGWHLNRDLKKVAYIKVLVCLSKSKYYVTEGF